MNRLVTPTLQITIGLLSLTISLIFVAYSFGLLPNESNAALEARAKISENLAVQLANLAERNNVAAINDTAKAMLSRNRDILSIAIRNAEGALLVDTGSHDVQWLEPAGKAAATRVLVPLWDAEVPRGQIEIAFRPIETGRELFGLPRAMVTFVCFIGFAGMAGYYFILTRSLRELDPSRAIPERVKAAFDTLAEGVLILDQRGFVLLSNDAFVRGIYPTSKPLLGLNVCTLPWVPGDDANPVAEFPWRIAMREVKPVLGVPMSICDHFGHQHKLLVNATRILDGKGSVRGVIATFDDVTALHETNEQLCNSIEQLHASQLTISEQNKQLLLLASSDPLTGCLNRRTFFAEAELKLQDARSQSRPMSFLMLDADHFKSVNDRFGHMVGDQVLIGLADIMKRVCHDKGLVGRYGGEEFCVAVYGLGERDVERLAEEIRGTVASVTNLLPTGEPVTISIGIASLTDGHCEIADLVKRADEALYAAKMGGRNRFVNWSHMPPQPLVTKATASSRSEPQAPAIVSTESRADHDEPARELSRNPVIERIDEMIRDDDGTRCFGMARIDIENVEYLNDRYGSAAREAWLAQIAQKIRSKLRRSDAVGHLAAGEFLLLFEPFESKELIEPIVERIRGELNRPAVIGGCELFGTYRIGVSVYPEHGRSYQALRERAQSAMSNAKAFRKGETVFFDATMAEAMATRFDAEQRLRRAIRDRSFCCAFQPKIDISRRKVVGFEALVRMRDERGGLHLPEKFIGLAIELGLIDQITDLVLEIALSSMDRLDAAFGSATKVSINIAAVLAKNREFMFRFVDAIRADKYANRLVLELTEDSFMGEGSFQSVIIPILREIGVGVSIDDFGTGYSSLGVLADITADEIKIDRSLIAGIHQRPRNQSILRAICSLGHALNVTIVAEGVESLEEVVYLQAAASIRFAQGFYFSEPFFLEDMAGIDIAERGTGVGKSQLSSRSLERT